jgi:uncharacterized integral membrane protein (TIGR00698 family)
VKAAAAAERPATPRLAAGLAFALVAAAAAVAGAAAQTRLLGQPLLEGLVLALLVGVAARNLLPADRIAALVPGAGYAAKQLLEVGVALLGAGLAAGEVLRAGPRLLGLIVVGVALAIVAGFLIGRALGLGRKLALLVAVGNAVRGNSAIAAVAPVIRAEKRDVASAVGLTALLGLGLVLGLPLLIGPLGLSDYQYGVLAGMSVYAVPQVVAAAFPVSQLSGEVATLVKLGRVLMLGPIVVAAGLLLRGDGARRGVAAYLPWFVLAFLGLAALRSVGLLPEAIAVPAREASRLLTTVAMAGLGFGVELAAARRVGPRVAAAAAASLLFLAGLTVAALRLGGLG